ncbi:hypothetical protein O0L34_g17975 [Tuta absoluta]|nr:hypothetical protein O0L34_g17975 [Tuta absoluta]
MMPPQKLKYILQWESPKKEPLITGQKAFIDRKCQHKNCYIVSSKKVLRNKSYLKYDVILFGPDLNNISINPALVQRRLPHQKYVFISSAASDSYPLKSDVFNGFFNWTWTYHLDSNLQWGLPFVVRSVQNRRIVAPKVKPRWILKRNASVKTWLTKDVEDLIRGRQRAVAWFLSNCSNSSSFRVRHQGNTTFSKREREIQNLKNILLQKYNLHLDTFGKCGEYECPEDNPKECNNFIKRNYFFYLAYEKSLSNDYVSDHLLRAINSITVPIVYGGADYNSFLPSGSYINASKMSTQELAALINRSVNNIRDSYLPYFKWKSYYSLHRTDSTPETDDYCRMCALVNNEEQLSQRTVYNNFTKWWTVHNIQIQHSTVRSHVRAQRKSAADCPRQKVVISKTAKYSSPRTKEIGFWARLKNSIRSFIRYMG